MRATSSTVIMISIDRRVCLGIIFSLFCLEAVMPHLPVLLAAHFHTATSTRSLALDSMVRFLASYKVRLAACVVCQRTKLESDLPSISAARSNSSRSPGSITTTGIVAVFFCLAIVSLVWFWLVSELNIHASYYQVNSRHE